jgi:hypothetical protein
MDSNKTIDEVPRNYFDHLPNHKKDKKYNYKYLALGVGLIIFGFILVRWMEKNRQQDISNKIEFLMKYDIHRPTGIYHC